MLFKNIRSSLEPLEFENKAIMMKRLDKLQQEIGKLNQKYKKANKDRLSALHIVTKMNEELEEALNNEKRFIASVSHELRTPLTAIIGYSELLEGTSLSNRQQQYLDSIVQSSYHLLSLVSDLLDVAKLGDNRIELSPKEIDLEEVLSDCAILIRSKINHTIDFVVDIPMLEYKVKGDDKRIKQIFLNLLSNAVKFTRQGSIHFYMKQIEMLENQRIKVVVNVDDTGSGISKEILNNLFEPFQSTDQTQGTGLGLFISQRFANMMNGDIKVESTEGEGSRFSVTLVFERLCKKELGKTLQGTHIMMFVKKQDNLLEKLFKEFTHLGVNFQSHNIVTQDISSSLIYMIASARFLNVAIFDFDAFEDNTCSIASTLKVINPRIKLIGLIGTTSNSRLEAFDKVLNRAMSYQRIIKEVEETYAAELLENEPTIDYSLLKILVVEDVEVNREYEKEMLNAFFSIQCDTAENGKEAVEKVRVQKYDAILMDLRMPVMNGIEATKEIRKFDLLTPIICMSANVYKEDKIAAELAGMNDFIEKPLERVDIENKLLKLLRREYTSEQKEEENLQAVALAHLSANFTPQTAQSLLDKALESIDKYRNQVEQHCRDKDKAFLVEDFHALKGVLSNLGLKTLAEQASRLQQEEVAFENVEAFIASKRDFLEKLKKLLMNYPVKSHHVIPV